MPQEFSEDTGSMGDQQIQQLIEKYRPTMVIFPEDPNLRAYGTPDKLTLDEQGDYHPCPVDLTLNNFQLYGKRKGKMGWLVNRIPALWAGRRRFRDPAHLSRGLPDKYPTERSWLKSLIERDVDLKKSTINLDNVKGANPEQAWAKYFDIAFDGDSRKPEYPVVTYVRVLEATDLAKKRELPDGFGSNDVALQFYFYYYFNDWFNRHEGDWEGITLLLREKDGDFTPDWVGYAAHIGGARREWADVNKSPDDQNSPLVFVGAGSHASYFEHREKGYRTLNRELKGPGFWKGVGRRSYWLAGKLGLSSKIEHWDVVPESSDETRVVPECVLIPENDNRKDPEFWWSSYSGYWGEIPSELVDFEGGELALSTPGPQGPWLQGSKWKNPFHWVMELPEGDPPGQPE
jgi:hypothetical protein